MKLGFQMRLRTLLILIALLGTISGLLGLQIRQQSLRRQRQPRRSGMYVAWVTLHGHCDAYKCLPAATLVDADGSPLSSWRLAALPFSPAGFSDWDAMRELDPSLPWDDPVNEVVTDEVMYFYCFAHDSKDATNGSRDTNVLAVTGPGTGFSMGGQNTLKNLPPNTVVLVEAFGTGIPWAAPGDLDVTELEGANTLLGGERDFHIAFADGSIWYMRADVPVENLRKFFLVESAREFDRDSELGPYRID